MACDTPAQIAILGAGPIGIEAGLYARFLGYDVTIYEHAPAVGGNVEQWGHVKMFSPFSMNSSRLGLAALAAQDERYEPPAEDALLTGHQWLTHYLRPLAQTDLLSDCLRVSTSVLGVARAGHLKSDVPGGQDRADAPFRIMWRNVGADCSEYADNADIVIDATGTYSHPNRFGDGGLPALGESQSADRIHYGLPDVEGKQKDRFGGRHVMVIGSGYSAATTVTALARLAEDHAGTHVTWVTRRHQQRPITPVENDRLPWRAELTANANALAESAGHVTHVAGAVVERVEMVSSAGDKLHVTMRTSKPGTKHSSELLLADHSDEESQSVEVTAVVDELIANVGFRGDHQLYRELHVHQCYATEGPIKLAAALMGDTSADCLDQSARGVETLVTPEPHFYILGSKSYGRNPRFLFANGLEQIRELFGLIGDRQDLNLYATPARTLN